MKVSTTLRLFLLIALFAAAQMLRLSGQGQTHQSQDQEHRPSESSDEKNVSDSDQQTPTLEPNERLVRIALAYQDDQFLRSDWGRLTIGRNKGPDSLWIQRKNEDGTFSFRAQQKFGRYLTCPQRIFNNMPGTMKMRSAGPFDGNSKFQISNVNGGLTVFRCENTRALMSVTGHREFSDVVVFNGRRPDPSKSLWTIVNA